MPVLKMPDPLTTADDLLLARRNASLTQGALAELTHLSVRQINQLENGKSKITPSTGAHLALIFAWIANQGASASPLAAGVSGQPLHTVVPPLPRAPGRPVTIRPGWTVIQYALTDGTLLANARQADALPIGTPYLQRSGNAAPWIPMIRAGATVLEDPAPSQATPVPTQAREPGTARLTPEQEAIWQAHMTALDRIGEEDK